MSSKYFYKDFKKEAEEEHKKFDAFQEVRTISKDKCNHKGKVKMVDGILRCQCGAAWGGPEIATLYKLFNGDIID